MSSVSATSSKRRWSLRAGVVAALVVSAVPASAAVIVQNFMSASVNRAAPCLQKVAGLDTSGTGVGDAIERQLANTANSTEGVPLLNEKIIFQGYRGDRLQVTDGVRVFNNCSYSVTVFLKAEPGLTATATEGNWTDMHMKVYLGKQILATATTPAPAFTGFSTVADWDVTPLLVNPASPGALTGTAAGVIPAANTTTGTVTLAAGKSVQLGYVVDVGSAALTSPLAGVTGTLNYTVNATKP